jgi:hypothetical protein
MITSFFALLQDIYELYSLNMLAIDGHAMVSAFDIIPARWLYSVQQKHFTP